jgi:hypothetical protein
MEIVLKMMHFVERLSAIFHLSLIVILLSLSNIKVQFARQRGEKARGSSTFQ